MKRVDFLFKLPRSFFEEASTLNSNPDAQTELLEDAQPDKRCACSHCRRQGRYLDASGRALVLPSFPSLPLCRPRDTAAVLTESTCTTCSGMADDAIANEPAFASLYRTTSRLAHFVQGMALCDLLTFTRKGSTSSQTGIASTCGVNCRNTIRWTRKASKL